MRVLVINPNTSDELTAEIDAAARRCARPGTEIVTVGAAWGPETVEGNYDEQVATVAMLEVVRERAAGCDGVVIACFGDPGLYAAREIAPVPVVGIAEAAMLLACPIADRFSVVTILARMEPHLRHLIRFHGLEHRCASIRATGLSVLDCARDPDAATAATIAAAREAVARDGAEAIVLGCSGMGGLERAVRDALDVPVIDGTAAAVKLVESLADCGLGTSRAGAFMAPAPKPFRERSG